MKNKFKKFLTCICFALIGCLTLTGCSLTAEQKNALDSITNNTENLVNSFDSYLDGLNSKISKESAAEVISRSRLNFLMSNFNEIQLTSNSKGYIGIKDQLQNEMCHTITYYSQEETKIEHIETINTNYNQSGSGKETTVNKTESLKKSDFENNIHYNWDYDDSVEDTELQETFENFNYSRKTWDLQYYDLFNQVPLFMLGDIKAEDIYNIESIENGYKFSIDVCISNVEDTKISSYEENEMVQIFYILLDVKVVDYCITEILFTGVQIHATIDQLENDGTDIYLNYKGVPTVQYGVDDVYVYTFETEVSYKYSNIDKTEIEAKIAEVEAEFLTQE